MSIENSYNFKKISSLITTSGVVGKERLESLSNESYKVVINLLPDDHKYAVPGEKEIVESQGIKYIHIPIDFESPKLEEFDHFTKEMERLGTRKMHIHCAANWRVTAFYGAYALLNGIWNKEQTNEFICAIWNPAEYPVWQNFLNKFGLS